MINSGVYEILNTKTNKRYIGSTIDFPMRWKKHRQDLETGNHHSPYLQRAWNKQGSGAFIFNRILICAASKTQLEMYEQLCIDQLEAEYNTSRVAGSRLGVKHTAETCKKISMSGIGHTVSLGTRAKIAASLIGKKHSILRCKNISAGKIGRPINYPLTRKSKKKMVC